MYQLITLAAEVAEAPPSEINYVVYLIEKLGLPVAMIVALGFIIFKLWKYYTKELKEQSKRHREENDEYLKKIEKLHEEKMDIAIKSNEAIKALADALKLPRPPQE
jgi:predicted negative regulator of RcsB-dependent stress response